MADPLSTFAVNAAVSFAVGAVVSALTPKTKIEGPRLNDLKAQASGYGGFIPRLDGTMRIAGNLCWVEDNQIKEAKHKEDVGGKGGPGAESTTYTYSASFAVMLCEGDISAIGRVWADAVLIADFSENATVGGVVEAGNLYTGLTIYKGESDQVVDDVIQANQSDTPAYRNTAYIVFEDLQLEKFGNRIPNITCEVTSDHTESYFLTETYEDQASETFPSTSPAYDWNTLETGIYYYIKSYALTAENGVMTEKTLDGSVIRDYAFTTANNSITQLNNNIVPVAFVRGMNALSAWGSTASGTEGLWLIGQSESHFEGSQALLRLDGTRLEVADANYYRIWVAVSNDTHVYGLQSFGSNSDTIRVLRFPREGNSISIRADAESVVFTGLYDLTDLYLQGGYLWGCGDNTGANNIVQYDLDLNVINEWTGLTTQVRDPGMVTDGKRFILAPSNPGGATDAWMAVYELQSGSMVQLHQSQITFPNGKELRPIQIADNLIIGWETYIHNGLVTTGTETLSAVVSDICTDAGLVAGDIDVTALTDEVKGYAITNLSSASSALEPLQIAYQFDAIESDYKLKFVKRGGSSVVTLTEDDLAAHEFGQARPEELIQQRAKEAGLPSEVSIKYIDQDRNYDPSEQYAQRSISKSEHKASIDLPLVQNAAEASQLAEIGLYNGWTERNTYSFTLPYKYAYLEATDIITITYGNRSHQLRITETTTGRPGIIEVKAVADRADLYVSSAAGFSGQAVSTGIAIDGPTNLKLLDIPILRDQDDDSGFYVAAGGYYAGWSGAVLMKSSDGGSSYVQTQPIINESTMGTSTDTLADGSTTVIDRTNTVNINVFNSKTLSSITEIAILNGANVAALGAHGRWEIIKFQTATLESDGTYTLSNLVRGYRGTEHNTANHTSSDEFVLLTTNMIRTASNDDEIGSERHYKGVTFGKNINSAKVNPFTNAAQGLYPYSPVLITGSIDGSNNWDIVWNRRTRIGAEWRDYVDTQLGEPAENYKVVIMDGAVEKRVIDVSAAITAQYTSADQVTDFGSNQTTIEVNIYQISAIVGRGHAGNKTLVG